MTDESEHHEGRVPLMAIDAMYGRRVGIAWNDLRLRWLAQAAVFETDQGRTSSIALAAGIIQGRSFTRAGRLLSRRLRLRLEPRVAPHGLTSEEVVWEIRGGKSTFTFHPGVLDHPYGCALIERWIDILPLLARVSSGHDGLSGRTSIALGDCGTGRGLAFCDHRPDALLIPDPVFMRQRGYSVQKRAFERRAVPWTRRTPRALWRGQTSGWHDAQGRPVKTWRDLPRVQLCQLALDSVHRGLIDAGITGVVQLVDLDPIQKEMLSGLMVPRLDWRHFSDWRYQIDVDGNTSAWEGLFVKLCTGSAVLKVASGFGFRQWYYERLAPWINVVPVAADLSDLPEKVLWLQRHDDRAEAIGRAAKALTNSMDSNTETDRSADTIRRALSAGT